MIWKRSFVVVCALLLFITAVPVYAATTKQPQQAIALSINGKAMPKESAPIMVNGSLYVPINALRSLGFSVSLSADSSTLTLNKFWNKYVLSFGSIEAIQDTDMKIKLPHQLLINKGIKYISVKTIMLLDPQISSKWDSKMSQLLIVDYGAELENALKADDLSKFERILKEKRVKPEAALEYVFYQQKSAEWAKVAIELSTNLLIPYNNFFEKAINLRRIDIVKLMIESGKVNPTHVPETTFKDSYVGLAHRQILTYTYDPTRKQPVIKYKSAPSFELAEILYEAGFRPSNDDIVYTYSQNIEDSYKWLNWMLSHGADPNGESLKLVELDVSEHNIIFHHALSVPDPTAKQKIIISAYYIATWNPNEENLNKFELLVSNYQTSLDPLTQAQKNRMLYLANSTGRAQLASVLTEAGAQIMN